MDMDIVKKSVPSLIANDILGVQPMTGIDPYNWKWHYPNWQNPGVNYEETSRVYEVKDDIDCFVCNIGGDWSTDVITLKWLDETCKWIPSKTTKFSQFDNKDVIYISSETIVFHRNGWLLRINVES